MRGMDLPSRDLGATPSRTILRPMTRIAAFRGVYANPYVLRALTDDLRTPRMLAYALPRPLAPARDRGEVAAHGEASAPRPRRPAIARLSS